MIDISYNDGFCDISYDGQITDDDVGKLIAVPFVDILGVESITKWSEDANDLYANEEGFSVMEFIETKLNPEQQCRVMEHFWAEIDKIRDRFPRPINIKRAES